MRFLRRLNPQRYYKYKKEVQDRNVIASYTFLLVGFIVATVNTLSNVFISATNGFIQGIGILVYFTIAALVRRYVVKENIKRSTLFLYAIQIPVMIFGILMGTVWDRHTVTITFFLLIVCMPPFILDNPIRHAAYITLMMVIYIILGYNTKDAVVFGADMVHALGFYMGSLFVSLFVLAERFDNIENYVLSEYRAGHDEFTGMKNRYALKSDLKNYVNRYIYVALVDIDYFKFFNDMYGHDFGEELVKRIGELSIEIFNENVCYRFVNDELLIIYEAESEDDFKGKLGQLKEGFGKVTIHGKQYHPSFSAGYVYGTPDSEADVQEMIRHSDVRLMESKNAARGTILGYQYDKSSKRKTDILAEVGLNINKSSLDELTGLPNMQFFRLRADEMLGNVIDLSERPVFVYLNIRNFKVYNEENGYRKGDNLLKDISIILKQEFDHDLISRFSEDHFVVLSVVLGIEEKLENINNKVKTLLGTTDISLSIGIYEYTEQEDVGAACDKAKLACDSIKHNFNVLFTYYDNSLEEKNRIQQYVIAHVNEAVDQGYIRVYYQPIVDIESGRIVELEALARWNDPVHGFLSPGDFIPVLEESRLIHKIDTFIAKQACKDQHLVSEKAGYDIPISINLSRLDFMLTDIVDEIISDVNESHITTRKIHIEITESALEDDKEDLIRKIGTLKDAGFEVWLDDFGSGYSSLNALQDFNFDVIKVDMSFMRKLFDNPQASVIVTSIINMIKDMKTKSLVEGVETEEQYNFLKDIGTDMAQGFLFNKPVPIEELEIPEK